VAGSCENGNEPSGSIECRKFLEALLACLLEVYSVRPDLVNYSHIFDYSLCTVYTDHLV
jgi:hypothetical protein